MNKCLQDEQLHSILHEELHAEILQTCDQHLSECPSCRARLESLTDVESLSRVMTWQKPGSQSSHLQQAIEHLQKEIMGSGETPSSPSCLVLAPHAIPFMKPCEQPGFLGRLGEIFIRRVLGRGGMGIVVEGFDPVLQRTVAVKVLSPHLLNRPEAKERFLREAQAAAALLHENVVAIHGIQESEGLPFLVLQYVDGETLSDRLQRENLLSFEAIVKLGLQIARGLAAAHACGLVHCDIKPGNILFDRSLGDVRITDFGLAKHLGVASVSEVGLLTGTPAYMSPEQASNSEIDARSDLFSLGIVLYQASSGHLPFTSDSPYDLLDQIKSSPETALSELNPSLPHWFCNLVHRLLCKDPENRFASAAELVRIFEQQGQVEPRAIPRRRRDWPYLLACSLLLGVLSVWWLWHNIPPVHNTLATVADTSGFWVNGSSYQSLSDAVEAAPDNSIIEVEGDGPFPSRTLFLETKPLTIRAKPGSHPRFIPEVTGSNVHMQFIVTKASLTLEGLEIYWPLSFNQVRAEEPITRSVIAAYQGKLKINHCRIVNGSGTGCLGSQGESMEVLHSHLIASNGTCMGWRAGGPAVLLENTIIDGRFLFTVLRPNGSGETVRSPLVMKNNLIKCNRMMQFFVDTQSNGVIDLHLKQNIIDANNLFLLTSIPRSTIFLESHDAMITQLKQSITIQEEANAYRRKMVYLGSNRFGNMSALNASHLRHLGGWQSYCHSEQSGSVEVGISFQDEVSLVPGKHSLLTLKTLEGAAPPPGVGLTTKHIGPGLGYSNWKKEGGTN